MIWQPGSTIYTARALPTSKAKYVATLFRILLSLSLFLPFSSDFAVRSCMVTDDGTVKLGDYGITRQTFKVQQENKLNFFNFMISHIIIHINKIILLIL